MKWLSCLVIAAVLSGPAQAQLFGTTPERVPPGWHYPKRMEYIPNGSPRWWWAMHMRKCKSLGGGYVLCRMRDF